MDLETVLYEKKERIAYVTLNRPERLNAFNPQMAHELEKVWHDIRDDNNVWVAILTGAGRGFCSGADMKVERLADPEAERQRRKGEAEGFAPIRARLWKPVICAVNGVCAGAGFHFVGESDIRICADTATFTDPHVNAGVVSAIEPTYLARQIPLESVLRMVLLGSWERKDAQWALRVGLVSEVLPQPQLMPRATELARVICENAPLAVQASKRAIWESLNMGLQEADRMARGAIETVWGTEDYAEGPRAFQEKRKPVWKGR